VLIAFQNRGHFFASAFRATNAVGPAEMLKVIAALLVIAETIY
jgi:hypothetical protein